VFAKQILQVREIVEERWGQGSYFSTKEGKVCCCVHGAAQYICNPQVRAILEKYFKDSERSPNPSDPEAAVWAVRAAARARLSLITRF